jgi:hypothetical protein
VTGNADLPLVMGEGTPPAQFPAPSGPVANFSIDRPIIAPGDDVAFTADPSPHTRFTWRFGDGTEAHGRRVRHRFADADGTELDGANGAGRFRVLLQALDKQAGDNRGKDKQGEDKQGRQDWASRGVVVVARWHDATEIAGARTPGLVWHIYPGAWTELPDLTKETAVFEGESPGIQADAHGFTRYATAWEGFIDVPADGGYTFHLMSRDGARLAIDGMQVAKTGPPFAQVCGSPGNAMRYDRGSLGLRAGLHLIHLEGLHFASQGAPRLLWEGPGIQLTEVPPDAYVHPRVNARGGDVPGFTGPRTGVSVAAPTMPAGTR